MDAPAAPEYAFTHHFTIEASDIDQLGHANNVAYLRWVQDVAAAHWHSLYPPDLGIPPQIWVVQEHRIQYHRSAYEGQELTARTWVADVQGARSKRLTRLERGGELLCSAETQWVLLDATSGRPVRVPSEVAGRLIPA